jgi:hypothetical protein
MWRYRDRFHRLKRHRYAGIRGTGTFMRELFILCTVVFALVSAGTATVVATALASEPAMAVAVR